MPENSSSGDLYRARIAEFARAAAPLAARYNRIANARLLAAVCAVGCLFAGVYWPHGPAAAVLWLAAALASAAGFVALLAVHAGVQQEKDRADGLRRINAQALAPTGARLVNAAAAGRPGRPPGKMSWRPTSISSATARSFT